MVEYVFVYGTLKRGYNNHDVLGNSKYLGPAITKDFSFNMYDGGFPFVSTGGDGKILGEVYLVDEEKVLEHLDILEGVPYLYVRHRTKVVEMYSLLEYNAIIYVASEGTKEGLKEKTPMKTRGRERVLEWEK